MLDLEPATRVLARIVEGVNDDQLTAPTPCPGATVGDLLGHVDGLSMAFTAAARKERLEGATGRSSADASPLGDDWRTRIPRRLAGLAAAWRDESAWTGMTHAGGVDLPAEVAGVVALDEVIVHGWDIAATSASASLSSSRLHSGLYRRRSRRTRTAVRGCSGRRPLTVRLG